MTDLWHEEPDVTSVVHDDGRLCLLHPTMGTWHPLHPDGYPLAPCLLPHPTYIVNNQSGSVHLASCGTRLRSAYASEWTPATATPCDKAHPSCLPGGLPRHNPEESTRG